MAKASLQEESGVSGRVHCSLPTPEMICKAFGSCHSVPPGKVCLCCCLNTKEFRPVMSLPLQRFKYRSAPIKRPPSSPFHDRYGYTNSNSSPKAPQKSLTLQVDVQRGYASWPCLDHGLQLQVAQRLSPESVLAELCALIFALSIPRLCLRVHAAWGVALPRFTP